MSSSNAAAIRRRVGAQAAPITPSNSSSNLTPIPENSSSEKKNKILTMTEMVTLLNSRVNAIEKGTDVSSTNNTQRRNPGQEVNNTVRANKLKTCN